MLDPIKEMTNPTIDVENKNEPSVSEVILKELLSEKSIKIKTDLNQAQIKALTKGTLYADLYNSNLMRSLVENISLYSVSKNRLGRKELVEMAHTYNTDIELEPTLSERLFGK